MTGMPLMAAIALGTAMLAWFIALPLLALARYRPATGWLAGFLLSFGALAFCDSGVLRLPLFGLFDWPVAALGAFYYCYVRSLSGLGNDRRQAAHFLPALVAAAVFVWLHWQLMRVPRGGQVTPAWIATVRVIVYASQVLTVCYMGAVLWRLRQHWRRVRECFSETGQRDLAWLAWMTGGLLALLLFWVPAATLGGIWGHLLDAGRILLMCFIGWNGIRQAPVFVPSLDATPLGVVAAEPALPLPHAAAISDALPQVRADRAKYSRSGMTDSVAELIGKRLEHRMTVTRD